MDSETSVYDGLAFCYQYLCPVSDVLVSMCGLTLRLQVLTPVCQGLTEVLGLNG